MTLCCLTKDYQVQDHSEVQFCYHLILISFQGYRTFFLHLNMEEDIFKNVSVFLLKSKDSKIVWSQKNEKRKKNMHTGL